MKMLKLLVIIFAIFWSVIGIAQQDNSSFNSNQYWPQWRGPLATGVAPFANPPLEWNENKNIRWEITLPGSGISTPIVWDDRIFLTTAVAYGNPVNPKATTAPGAHDNLPITSRYKFAVIAVNRLDGKILWNRVVHQELPHENYHYTGSLASNSPVTDGERVYVFFGSRGLFCLDFDGKLLWQKDLGKMQVKHAHGEGSSPALYGETLVVNWDHEGQSFVIALDKRTGEQRWKVNRDEVTSWSSPIVVEVDGKPQVIVNGTNRIRGYELATGKVIWECGGLSGNIVASPVAGNGMVFAGSSYEIQAMLAIRLQEATGDITGSKQVVWSRRRGTPYVPSLLLYDDALYFLRHYQGVLSRVNAKTGADQNGMFRLYGIRNVYASPVGAADRIYITDLDGTTLVINHEDNPNILALNKLDDSFSASAAIAGNDLFLRGREYLYCISEE